MENWYWDGKDVEVLRRRDFALTHKHIRIDLTEKAARTLAICLARLKQTTFTLPEEVQELLLAIDYVTVGDPESTRMHDAMEIGKGMTPDGGFREPSKTFNRPIGPLRGPARLDDRRDA